MAVYFMQSIPGAPIKIGNSKCPSVRATQVRCPLTRQHPRVLVEVPKSGCALERQFQERFASRRIRVSAEGRCLPGPTSTGRVHHTRSEWFSPCPELLALIAELTS